MPELPEVEVLVRHLRPAIIGRTIRGVEVRRAKVLATTRPHALRKVLIGARFTNLSRRGKYLLFQLRSARNGKVATLVGHLGMTGRIYLTKKNLALPKHAAVVLDLGATRFVYEDTRYFGRLTLDGSSVNKLGPEPLGGDFTADYLSNGLKRSQQAIKVKLLDQTLVAGIGNIYASEVLFKAQIFPKLAAAKLSKDQIKRLRLAIRQVLRKAIVGGSTVPLNFANRAERDGLFYFGRAPGTPDFYEERLLVYDREGQPCPNCGNRIKHIVQAARSTYFCPRCQGRT